MSGRAKQGSKLSLAHRPEKCIITSVVRVLKNRSDHKDDTDPFKNFNRSTVFSPRWNLGRMKLTFASNSMPAGYGIRYACMLCTETVTN
jgi:hypothetical protein